MRICSLLIFEVAMFFGGDLRTTILSACKLNEIGPFYLAVLNSLLPSLAMPSTVLNTNVQQVITIKSVKTRKQNPFIPSTGASRLFPRTNDTLHAPYRCLRTRIATRSSSYGHPNVRYRTPPSRSHPIERRSRSFYRIL